MELLCTTASVKSRIHFACNLRTAMSQLLLVFLPLDCGACLFKAPPVCLFTQVINDHHEIENIDNINVCYRLHPLLIYLYYLYYIRQVTGMLSLQTHRILWNSRRLKILFRFIFGVLGDLILYWKSSKPNPQRLALLPQETLLRVVKSHVSAVWSWSTMNNLLKLPSCDAPDGVRTSTCSTWT